ncbi:MAG: hypothetical protein KDB07_06010 [Planctomycetes bacterium]|nr:hypothetical protein [Planctomycetota bacterium]
MSEQHPELCTTCTDSPIKAKIAAIEERFNSPSALRAIRAERAAEGGEQGYGPAPVSADQVVPSLDFVRRPFSWRVYRYLQTLARGELRVFGCYDEVSALGMVGSPPQGVECEVPTMGLVAHSVQALLWGKRNGHILRK